MKLQEAFEIVLELAADNALDLKDLIDEPSSSDMLEECERQRQAIALVRAHSTAHLASD